MIKTLVSLAKELEKEPKIVIFLVKNVSFKEMKELCIRRNKLIEVKTVFPSTFTAAMASFFTGLLPEEHKLFGKEVFLGGCSINIREGRVSKKERKIFKHYARFGRVMLLWNRLKILFFPIVWRIGKKRLFKNATVLLKKADYPFLYKLLGLKNLCFVNSLEDAIELIKKDSKLRTKKKQWIILGYTFGLNEGDIIRIFDRYANQKRSKTRKVLISLNGKKESDYSLMLTQGEILYFMKKGVYFSLNQRVCLVYGKKSMVSKVKSFLVDKFKSRVKIRSPAECFKKNSKGMPLLVVVARKRYVFAYEEIPPSVSSGGDSCEELITAMIEQSK